MEAIIALDVKNGFAKDGKCPWKNKNDLKFFIEHTKNKNIVMGRKTYESMPKIKPYGRKFFVLTRNCLTEIKGNFEVEKITINQVPTENVIIIGGLEIIKIFYKDLKKIYYTRFKKDYECDTFLETSLVADSASTLIKETDELEFREINFETEKHDEQNYLDLIKNVITNGISKPNRTGYDSTSIFAPNPLRFDLSNNILPLFTTKKVPVDCIIHELLFFLKGITNVKYLQDRKVGIWNGNTSREFLDKTGKSHLKENSLNAGYSFQMRSFGGNYDFGTCNDGGVNLNGGFDQIMYMHNLLINEPNSRRILMNLWNSKDLDNMSLSPCHNQFQMYVSGKRLKGHLYMRSSDIILGLPFNVCSYSILLHLFAKNCDLEADELIVSFGDCHIYNVYIEKVQRMLLNRRPLVFPKIEILKKCAYEDYEIEDFKITDYSSHKGLKFDMIV